MNSSSFDLGCFPFHEEKASSESSSKPQKFSWRLDPEESFSDWTILLDVIKRSDDDDHDDHDDDRDDHDEYDDLKEEVIQTEFHVHKSYLAAGERHSLYFQRVFKVQHLGESLDATSRIQLEESAARAIPTFLDFMYDTGEDPQPLQITTESAVALRWIASYFGVEPMYVEVNDFINKDLLSSPNGIQNCLSYLKEAAIYCDEKVAQAACKVCAKKFGKLKVEDMVRLSPTQFSSIVEQAKTHCGATNSDLMSHRVATYCDARRDDIAPEMLLKWTDPDYMNVINAKAAVSLLRHAEEATTTTPIGDSATNADHFSLMERCIEAASSNWQAALVDNIRNPEEARQSGYAAVSIETRCRVLERALSIADEQLNHTKRRLETSQARISALHAHVRFENVVVMAASAEDGGRAREGWSSITDDSYDSDDSGLMTS